MLPQTIQSNDQRLKPGLVMRRLVAEQNGEMVGNALFFHMEWVHHPQKFGVGISVHPQHQGKGIGSLLYQHLMDELGSFDPIRLIAWVREDKPTALRFASKHGFQEHFRAWESKLNLHAFEPQRWAKDVEKALAQGYQIKSFADLESDPQRERKMYELDLEGSRDVPLPPGETFTFPSQERYWEQVYQKPDFDPSLWFLALKDSEYVGISMLYRRPADNDLDTGFTTVKPAHRRRGVALALKATALAHAKSLGKTAVRTDNAQINRPMLSINEALGFEKMPAWIDLVKVLREE
jgi:GNAT superfamily N-acetyltransferase